MSGVALYWSDSIERELVGILRDLIRIRSVSDLHCEVRVCEYIASLLARERIDCRIHESAPGRGNLAASIEAGSAESVVMISHVDVVDVDPSKWTADPFGAECRDGRIYGRGTIDTKQLTAMELMVMLLIRRNRAPIRYNLRLIATADEEKGSRFGMDYLTAHYPEYFGPGYYINEGGGFVLPDTDLRICTCAEKGVCELKIMLRGGESLAEEFEDLMRLVSQAELDAIDGPIHRMFHEKVGSRIDSNPTVRNLNDYMCRETLTIGAFDLDASGGSGADPAEVRVTYRFSPYKGKEEVLRYMDSVIGGRFPYEVARFFTGFASDVGGEFYRCLERSSRRDGDRCEIVPIVALGNTDGRFIGRNVYGYSPMTSEDSFDKVLKMVHGNDESIAVSSLVYGTKVLLRAVLEFNGIFDAPGL